MGFSSFSLRISYFRINREATESRIAGAAFQWLLCWFPEIGAERLRARGMAEAANRLLLDLPNALAGELEAFADLLERQRMLAVEPEVEADHLGLTLRKRGERATHFDLQRLRHETHVGRRLRLV